MPPHLETSSRFLFSRHMARDDAGTFARLRAIREHLFDFKIAEYGGHVVKIDSFPGFLLRRWQYRRHAEP